MYGETSEKGANWVAPTEELDLHQWDVHATEPLWSEDGKVAA